MGNNYHNSYTTDTRWVPEDVNPALQALDKAITSLKNYIVHCDGAIAYNKTTGALSWDGALRVLFSRADGILVQNYVAAGSVILTDGQIAFIDLSDTDGALVAAQVTTLTPGSASSVVAVGRLVLGYRNTTSDDFYSVAIRQPVTGGASATSFLLLTDTPDGYAGQGGKVLAVKADATGLEFVSNGSGGSAILFEEKTIGSGSYASTGLWTKGFAGYTSITNQFSGTVTKAAFQADFPSPSSTYRMAICSNNNGAPGVVLALSDVCAGISAGENVVPLVSPVTLATGTVYWVGLIIQTADFTVRLRAGGSKYVATAGTVFADNPSVSAWPSEWVLYAKINVMSFYLKSEIDTMMGDVAAALTAINGG